MNRNNDSKQQLQLFRSGEHSCSYLDEQPARTLFLDPAQPMAMPLYSVLIDHGFRRSGEMVYRPDCPACDACQSIRVMANRFTPRRNQRRIWQRLNNEVAVTEKPMAFDAKHYALFKRYLTHRHADGEMASTSEQGYMEFISSSWSDTRLFEFHLDQQLLAIAVTDLLSQGMSAVYTFFDPDQERLSPGVFTVLWQIEECKRRQSPWLYLGYWIAECRKMTYKTQYRPCQHYIDNHWKAYTGGND